VVWQWEHRTGFRDYDAAASVRIEKAYQHGDAYVRMKSGKGGAVPMEIFFADMIQYDPVSGNTRMVVRLGPNGLRVRLWRWLAEVITAFQTGKPRGMLFKQYEQDRRALFQDSNNRGLENRLEHQKTRADLYKTEGVWQKIARSSSFFVCSMAAVLLNVMWMAIDAEFNDAATISEAAWHFQVVENAFCVIFTIEVVVRFLALKARGFLKDRWFLFDALLLVSQVLETWVIPLILTGHVGKELSILQVARLLRLARLGRLMRMLRLFPDVLALLKGIGRAMRPVFYVMLVLIVLLFVFSFVFKTLASDDENLSAMFPSLLETMGILLFCGTLLDNPSTAFYDIMEHSFPLAFLFLVFIFLSSLTLLNMLIGILCDVVFEVSKLEKDDAALALLKNTLLNLLECYDKDDDQCIGVEEFDLLMANPETSKILRRFDVDASGLLSLREVLFEYKYEAASPRSSPRSSPWAQSPADGDSKSQGHTGSCSSMQKIKTEVWDRKKLTFSELLEVILRLRGGKTSTVTDMMELREYVKQRLDSREVQLNEHSRQLSDIQTLQSEISHYVKQRLDQQELQLNDHGSRLGKATAMLLEMSKSIRSIEVQLSNSVGHGAL